MGLKYLNKLTFLALEGKRMKVYKLRTTNVESHIDFPNDVAFLCYASEKSIMKINCMKIFVIFSEKVNNQDE